MLNFKEYHKCLLCYRLTSRDQLYICSFKVGLLRKCPKSCFLATCLLLLLVFVPCWGVHRLTSPVLVATYAVTAALSQIPDVNKEAVACVQVYSFWWHGFEYSQCTLYLNNSATISLCSD